MKINTLHPWNITETQAASIQKSLSAWIILDDQPSYKVSCIARAQLLYNLDDEYSTANVTLFRLPDFKVIERHSATQRLDFPPIPGLLSFRKAPVVLKALEALKNQPDLIICDGRGVTGSERFGLASHIGLMSNIPTVGWRAAPNSPVTRRMRRQRGSWIPLSSGEQTYGALLRIHRDLPPIYVSPAHQISLKQALLSSLKAVPSSLENADMLELLTPQPIAQLNPLTPSKEIS
ncbi:endonuclease V [Aestuariirhabdus sp. Z084]|uniref:endonuclease V n=1 Tax=Aestuariirhabdus haliotis TaxID=2918751 RepID=UPI00201B4412|nr:endonuclease V [Aestuariirhabdus haliotis]MCL6416883.1 endonuclease V [Aestuariirhabdus haliotis]MCL6420898.1 endonuclease V [Aestuariirhabdus haliotis]